MSNAGSPVVRSSEKNTASNVGAGEGVYKQKTGVNLELKSLTAGAGVSLTGNTNDVEIAIDLLDEDNMASDSATKPASQQSIVAYITAQLAGVSAGMVFQGDYNASTNSPDLDSSPSGIEIGDTYVVSTAGTFFTEAVEAGDTLIAKQDDPTTLAHWVIVQTNLTAATIKTAYESNADTNALTDAMVTLLGNTSGTNSGDEDASSLATKGALMDSEIDNLDDVKSFDPADYATAAQGAKVDYLTVTQSVDLDTMESDVATNNAKTSNATHIGDVTGSTSLTVDPAAISGKSLVTAVGADHVMILDATDGTLKKALISDFASAGGDMGVATYDPATIAEQVVGLTASQTLTNKTLTSPVVNSPTGIDADDIDDASTTNKFVTASDVANLGNLSGSNSGDESSATDSAEGIVELATIAEINTGTDPARVITPAGLAGSALASEVTANTAKTSNATHVGDVTGATTLTIADEAVTNAKLAHIATDTIKGRTTAGAGDVEDLSASQVRAILNVEDGADVTDATSVNAAGAVMNSDTDVSAMSFSIDEDNMASDSATKFPTQQSVKAYVDANAGGDVVDDTTPQLGGALDTQGNEISGGATTSQAILSGNSGAGGANLTLYGSAHASKANDVELKVNGSTELLMWDNSALTLEARTLFQHTAVSIAGTSTASISRFHTLGATGSDYTVTLPAAGTAGRVIAFLGLSGLDGIVTIDGNSSETINGATSYKMSANDSLYLRDNGTNWDIVHEYREHYISSAQTITSAALLTLAHGLGRRPQQIVSSLVFTTAEDGYSIGDELLIQLNNNSSSGANIYNAVYFDDTNIYVRFSSNSNCFNTAQKSTGAAVSLTNSNIELHIIAR